MNAKEYAAKVQAHWEKKHFERGGQVAVDEYHQRLKDFKIRKVEAEDIDSGNQYEIDLAREENRMGVE